MSSPVIEWIESNGTPEPDTTAIVSPVMTSQPQPIGTCRAEHECKLFIVIVNTIVLLIMFVLGFIGNTLSFIVLRTDRNNATFLLKVNTQQMKCISISNIAIVSHKFAITI